MNKCQFILVVASLFGSRAQFINGNCLISEKYCTKMAPQLFACDFEVIGKVQGVFFRKYTEKQAKTLGLKGWCMNTPGGTVKGQLEGPQSEMNEMKNWLQFKGSPSSRIDKAIFSELKQIDGHKFNNFSIKR